MSLEKLNIQTKIDNAAKQRLVASSVIGTNETLLATEVNAIVEKTNELVEAYNFGAPITAFNFKKNVATYADLLLIEEKEVNDGYGVQADGLVYVWNGEDFPTQGNGMDLGLKPNGEVKEGDLRAVNGNKTHRFVEERVGDVIVLGNNLINIKGLLRAGNYTSSGAFTVSNNYISSQPYIVDGEKFILTKKYTISGIGGIATNTPRIIFKDINGTVISIINGTGTAANLIKPVPFSFPPDTHSFCINLAQGSGVGSDLNNSEYNTKFMINEGDSALPYSRFGYVLKEGLMEAYISPIGNDSNSGASPESPIKTFKKAVEITHKNGVLFFMPGDYENLDFDVSAIKNIRTYSNSDVRLIYGTKITSANFSEGVYSFPYKHIGTWLQNYSIWQHDIPDEYTEIEMIYRHPVHSGLKYRLPSKKLDWVESIDAINNSLVPCYFYDGTTIYFKIKEGSSLLENPVIIPTSDSLKKTGSNIGISHSGYSILYAPLSLSNMYGRLSDISVGMANNTTGMIITNNALGLDFFRTRAYASSNDGFNGHVTSSTVGKILNVRLNDCWAHDCKDDAESHHSFCNIQVDGGLFEYSGSGCTPAGGAHAIYRNVTVQKCLNTGFQAQGESLDGGIGTQIHTYGCVSDSNGKNFEGRGFDSRFVNSISIRPISTHFSGQYQKINCFEIN